MLIERKHKHSRLLDHDSVLSHARRGMYCSGLLSWAELYIATFGWMTKCLCPSNGHKRVMNVSCALTLLLDHSGYSKGISPANDGIEAIISRNPV